VTGTAAAKLMAVLASGLCLFAGGFLLLSTFTNEDIKLLAGWIGIFFLGMSLFVGPTLWLLADLRARSEAADEVEPSEQVEPTKAQSEPAVPSDANGDADIPEPPS
jgi:hypothetical protein